MSFHAFRGQRTSSALPKAQAFSQAIFRDGRRSFDQHGRPWSWPADKQTGMPCGIISPEGWHAPWLMDQGPDFYVINPDNTAELFLNYRTFVKSRVTALKEFHDLALRAARKAGLKAPKVGQYSEELLEAMGSQPPRAYQLAIACEQENPWALGFDTAIDGRLAEYLEGPSTVVDEAFESFDFGPKSYAQNSDGRARDPREAGTIPRKFKSFAELKQDIVTGKTAAEETLEFEEALNDRTADDAEADADIDEVAITGDATEQTIDDIEDEPMPVTGQEEYVDEALEDIEEEADAAAIGGKVVNPRSAKAGGQGKKKKAAVQRARPSARPNARPFVKGDRPSLAEGARPVVSD